MSNDLYDLQNDLNKLQADLWEEESTRICLSNLLGEIAVALKGDPGPLKMHGFADLPEVARNLQAENRELFAMFLAEQGRGGATSERWHVNQLGEWVVTNKWRIYKNVLLKWESMHWVTHSTDHTSVRAAMFAADRIDKIESTCPCQPQQPTSWVATKFPF